VKRKKFICYSTEDEFQADYEAGTYEVPYIAKTLDDGQIHVVKETSEVEVDALGIENLTDTDGTITIKSLASPSTAQTISYSTDNGQTWQNISQSSKQRNLVIPLLANSTT